jgi:hypothetical protein
MGCRTVSHISFPAPQVLIDIDFHSAQVFRHSWRPYRGELHILSLLLSSNLPMSLVTSLTY